MKDFIVLLAIITGFVLLGLFAWQKHEVSECLRWQQQAREIPGYFVTDWQKEQCNRYDLTL